MALRDVLEIGVTPVDADDAVTVIHEVESLRRLADIATVETVAAIDQTGVYVSDGPASATAMQHDRRDFERLV